MKKYLTVGFLCAGLALPLWAEEGKKGKQKQGGKRDQAAKHELGDSDKGPKAGDDKHDQPKGKDAKPLSPLQEAMQKYQQAQMENAQDLEKTMGGLAESGQAMAFKVAEALAPMAEKMKKQMEEEAPEVIEAAAEEARANGKLLNSLLKAAKNVAKEVAE